MTKRIDPNEAWCRQNASADEHTAFWKNWCETQWGMPTFDIMRRRIETRRAQLNN